MNSTRHRRPWHRAVLLVAVSILAGAATPEAAVPPTDHVIQ